MRGETRRAGADGHQRGVADGMKKRRGRMEREKWAIGSGELATLGCRRNVKYDGEIASERSAVAAAAGAGWGMVARWAV